MTRGLKTDGRKKEKNTGKKEKRKKDKKKGKRITTPATKEKKIKILHNAESISTGSQGGLTAVCGWLYDIDTTSHGRLCLAIRNSAICQLIFTAKSSGRGRLEKKSLWFFLFLGFKRSLGKSERQKREEEEKKEAEK